MPLPTPLAKSSTLTALAACLFTAGVVLLFVVLFHETIRAGPAPIIAGVLLIVAVASWIAAARARKRESGET
jgi:hypothetical protein